MKRQRKLGIVGKRIFSSILTVALVLTSLATAPPGVVSKAETAPEYEQLAISRWSLNGNTILGTSDSAALRVSKLDTKNSFFIDGKTVRVLLASDTFRGGFPTSGSMTIGNVPYSLTYNGKDSVKLSSLSSKRIVKIRNASAYGHLNVLATAAGPGVEHYARFTVTLTYTKGSPVTKTIKLDDWANGSKNDFVTKSTSYKRVKTGGIYGYSVDNNTNVYLQSINIETDPFRVLKNVTFTMNGIDETNKKSGLYCGVYAMTAQYQEGAPVAPVAIAATDIGITNMTANWKPVDGATSYRLDVSKYPEFVDDDDEPSYVGDYDDYEVSGTSINLEKLAPNTTYYYRVRAVNENGQSKNSNVINATTGKSTHVHSDILYTVEGNKIIATCTNKATGGDDICSLDDGNGNQSIEISIGISDDYLVEEDEYEYTVKGLLDFNALRKELGKKELSKSDVLPFLNGKKQSSLPKSKGNYEARLSLPENSKITATLPYTIHTQDDVNLKEFQEYKDDLKAQIEEMVDTSETSEDSEALQKAAQDAIDALDNIKYDSKKDIDTNLANLDKVFNDGVKAIETQAKLDFDEYKQEKSDYLSTIEGANLTPAQKNIIDTAIGKIAETNYNNDLTPKENRDVIDKIVKDAEKALFESDQASAKETAAGLVAENDPQEYKDLVKAAQDKIDELKYDDELSFEQNEDKIKAILDELEKTIEEKKLAANKASMDEYKTQLINKIDNEIAEPETDSEASEALISAAKAAIADYEYQTKDSSGNSMTYEDNKAKLDEIVTKLIEDLEDQRGLEKFVAEKPGKIDEVTALEEKGDSPESIALIDKAKGDIEALQYDKDKTLEENEARIEKIIADLNEALQTQRDSEQAAKEAEFNTYRDAKADEVGALTSNDNSAAVNELIADAQKEISELAYDQTKSLDENKAKVDEIISKLKKDIRAQKATELANDKAAFEAYKAKYADENGEADKLKVLNDSPAAIELIEAAKGDIQDLLYDETKSLADNKTRVDDIMTKLREDLAALRDSEFAQHKTEQKAYADSLIKEGVDSAEIETLVDTYKKKIDDLSYNSEASIKANNEAIDAIIAELEGKIEAKRAEELAANEAEFEDYKTEKEGIVDGMGIEGDSPAVDKLITDAKTEIDNTDYDPDKSLNDNEAVIDDIVNELGKELEVQREYDKEQQELDNDKAKFEEYKKAVIDKEEEPSTLDRTLETLKTEYAAVEGAENKINDIANEIKELEYNSAKDLDGNKKVVDDMVDELEFNLYKDTKKAAADEVGGTNPSKAVKDLIDAAKEKIGDLQYDNNMVSDGKTALENNKAAVDAILAELAAAVAKQNKEDAFEAFKNEKKSDADALKNTGDSAAIDRLIDNAKKAIDNTPYDPNKTEEQNKAVINDIMTKLEQDINDRRALEKLNSDKAEFEAYKVAQEAAIEDYGETGDSAAVKKLIDEAQDKIDNLVYDSTENKTLVDNKARVDAIVNEYKAKIDAQREKDNLEANKAAFERYKTTKENVASGLAQPGDSQAIKDLVEAAINDISGMQYNEADPVSGKVNNDRVDARIEKLKADIAAQKAKEQLAKDKETFDAYKETKKGDDALKPVEGDSNEVAELITEAKNAIGAVNYVDEKSLAENKKAVDDKLAEYVKKIEDQRVADKLAEDKKAFDAYKAGVKADDAIKIVEGENGDSDKVKELKAAAQEAIAGVQYDESKTLAQNEAVVDAKLAEYKKKIAAQKAEEAKNASLADRVAAFEEYKPDKMDEEEAFYQEKDSQTIRDMIDEAKKEIEDLGYNDNLTFDANTDIIDQMVADLEEQVKEQREKDAYIHGDWTFKAEGDTLTATCGHGSCALPDHKIVLNVEPTDEKTYTGKAEDWIKVGGDSDFAKETEAVIGEVKYYTDSNLTSETTSKDGASKNGAAPTEVGTYYAAVTVKVGENESYVVKREFTIEKGSPNTVSKDSLKVSGETIYGKEDGSIAGVDDTCEYSTDGGKTWVPVENGKTVINNLPAGNYLVRKEATENTNPSKPVEVQVKHGDKIKVVLPEKQPGYTIIASPTEVGYNESATLIIVPDEGYVPDKNGIKIVIGGEEKIIVPDSDGKYRFQTKKVTKKEDAVVPDVSGITKKEDKPNNKPDVNPVVPDVKVSYHTHIQTIGDAQPIKSDGQMAGTTGKSKRMENIQIKVEGNKNLGIQYAVHCKTYGWLTWSKNGEISGTSGEYRRAEAIKIKLTGADKDKYDVYYRVHAQTYGWMAWAKNGEPAGTAGLAKRLEAIQVIVVKKGSKAPGINYCGVNGGVGAHSSKAFIDKIKREVVIPGVDTDINISYQTHVETYGWQNWMVNGAKAGTSGVGKRIEAIRIRVTDSDYQGGITYQPYLQGGGWKNWSRDGVIAGTTGLAKRMEAIKINLYGEVADHYDVYYRVHSQTYGWMAWAKNGQPAGTNGMSKRLESIQIVLVPKGGKAPSNNYGGAISKNPKAFIAK